MGLFDFFKRDRGYKVHALNFCEVGKDGKRDSRPENRLYNNARYVMPVARITSRIERKVTMTVRITAPDGKVNSYDFEAPLQICENRLANLPAWGSEEGTAFKTVGWWEYELLDKKGELIISSRLHIVPVEELWDEQGWIRIESDFQFRNNDSEQTVIDDWGTGSFVSPRYMAMRCRYSSLSDVEREITYDVEIRNEQTGKTSRFDHTVTLDPAGGWLQMCGWGSDSGNSYDPGRYTYLLCYKGRQVGSGQFEVEKSPMQRGWIEPVALVFYFYNDEKEMTDWVAYDCGLSLLEGGVARQLQFRANACKYMIAGFQWRSLEAGHPLKLTFRFYLDGNLIYSCSRDRETEPFDPQSLFYKDFEISGTFWYERSDGSVDTFRAGRYQVNLYLETDELHEHLVMQRTLELR